MRSTRNGAAQSPIRVFGGGNRLNIHPMGVGTGEMEVEDRAPQAQEMHGKPNIFPRDFKLRYLCGYWELEA